MELEVRESWKSENAASLIIICFLLLQTNMNLEYALIVYARSIIAYTQSQAGLI